MKSFKESILLDEAKAKGKVIVVYGGGFQPFHAGHLSSYTQAKAKFHTPDFYVASSNDTKVRPIPFKDKEFLAQQAGVTDDFVQVVQPINPEEIMKKYDEKKDVLILVRSERDPMKYTKKDGSPAYYQPFVSIDKCESFETHAYIFVTKKHDFTVNGKEAFSGSQVRKMYSDADSESRDKIIDDLYPKAKNKAKVKKLLDKYIGGGMNEELELDEGMGLYRYNKVTGYWKLEREVTSETKDKWLDIFTKDSPKDHFVISSRKPTKNPMKEELEQQDEAVLGYAQRRQRAQQFKRIQKRLVRARAMQSKRFADPKRLKRRAAKMAYQFFRGRLSGGKNYADLGTGEKISVDTRLQKMLPAIKKFAVRLVPAARGKEVARRQSMMMRKEDLNHMFEEFIVEKPTIPQDKDIAKRDGTQPKKYYVGLDKDTKDARASHFEKTGPKSDSDKSAYNDAPGDKEAREKGMQQSKHTLKFKKMFGEAVKTPEDRKEISRLDQLVRLGLADTKSLAVIKRSVEKLKSGDMLNPSERNITNDLLTTLLDMVTSSDALFRMTKTQLQKESVDDEYGDYDETDGLSMAQIEVSNMIQDAEELLDMMDQMDEEPDAWVLSKITKAADYVSTVRDYLEFEDDFDYEDDAEGDEYEDDDGEFTGAELDMFASEMEPNEFGDAYEEFKPILEEIEGLKKKAEKSGISYSILKAVYDRGMAAWQGGHRPGTTPQQWAFARVNSFITKGPGTWGKADKDLASKVNKNEEFSKFAEALEYGTDALRKKYAKDTPGQSEETCCNDCEDEITEDVDWEQIVNEAEYQGKSVKLNDPFRTPDGPKKFGVYTMGPNGNVVIVRFGDPNMEIKRDDPDRRASFRARHGCDDDPGPKYKAKYWSCYQWRSGAKVDS